MLEIPKFEWSLIGCEIPIKGGDVFPEITNHVAYRL